MTDKSSASASGKKRKVSDDSASGRKRQAISTGTKVIITEKLNSGKKMVNLARAYGINRSTVRNDSPFSTTNYVCSATLLYR